MEDPEVQKWMNAKAYFIRLNADEQAACRRVCIGFVQPDQSLISDTTVQTLCARAKAKAALGRERRAAAASSMD